VSNAPQRYASPLRYPGGKAKVVNFLKLLLIENDLVGSEYVEPYAGGASVALSLLYEDYVSAIHINDLNLGVHDFWQSALHNTDKFCELVDQTPLTVEEWRRQRDIAISDNSDALARGFSTFYLNRTNRSGIISGGVIGGLDQTGPWKIDARFPRDRLTRCIRKVARFRSRITVTRRDTLELLLSALPSEDGRRFYFLDPPYYVKGERLYDNFYNHSDHEKICDAVAGMKDPWVVSYDAAPEIMHMYSECRSLLYSMPYSASTRTRGSEVMFSAPGLVMPEETPSDISASRVDNARVGTLMLPFA
jgi:DNA adenine methylase